MSLQNVFKFAAVIFFINGLGSLLMTETFMEAASFEMSPSLLTFGQFVGVTFLGLGLIYWRTADLAGDALPALGQTFGIVHLMWVAIIGYHVAIGAAAGPTAYVNLAITALVGIAFFVMSKK